MFSKTNKQFLHHCNFILQFCGIINIAEIFRYQNLRFYFRKRARSHVKEMRKILISAPPTPFSNIGWNRNRRSP